MATKKKEKKNGATQFVMMACSAKLRMAMAIRKGMMLEQVVMVFRAVLRVHEQEDKHTRRRDKEPDTGEGPHPRKERKKKARRRERDTHTHKKIERGSKE